MFPIVLFSLPMIPAIITANDNFGPFQQIVGDKPRYISIKIELVLQIGVFTKNCVASVKQKPIHHP